MELLGEWRGPSAPAQGNHCGDPGARSDRDTATVTAARWGRRRRGVGSEPGAPPPAPKWEEVTWRPRVRGTARN